MAPLAVTTFTVLIQRDQGVGVYKYQVILKADFLCNHDHNNMFLFTAQLKATDCCH